MDINGQLTFTDSPLNEKFNEGLSYIQKGDLKKTLEIMEEIFNLSPNYTGVVEAIKSIKFWQNRWSKIFQIKEGYERAQYLLNEWENYNNFILSNKINHTGVIIHLKNFIFKKIIKNLILTYHQSDIPNIEILIQMGEIFLSIDEIQKAIETLEYAKLFRKRDSYLLSLLADAYYRNNNIKLSKLLYREAFLYNPEKIVLSKLTADFISVIMNYIVKNFNYPNNLILQWIPIYGILLNYFNFKRELSIDEINKLKEEIEELENQYHAKHFIDDFSVPKLINRYFWILDYYILQNNNEEYIKIYLDKLKNINSTVYKEYLSIINSKKMN